MPASLAFSPGVDRLFQDLRAYSANGTASFPRNLKDKDARRQHGETLQRWFVRVTDEFSRGRSKSCAVEDNIAIFAHVQWAGSLLRFASIQALIASCDLNDFYGDQEADAQYLRLDFDDQTLGDPFSHPLPHIHVGDGCSARFSLDGGTSPNVVVDFVEFIYRHYAPGRWWSWVERTWNQHFEKVSQGDDEASPLGRIFEAFEKNQFNVLRDLRQTLIELKAALRRRKDELFRLPVDRADRELLEYPAGH